MNAKLNEYRRSKLKVKSICKDNKEKKKQANEERVIQ